MVWLVKKLGDVCNIVGGGTPSKSNDSFYEGDIPWATVRDMRNDRLSRTELSITEEAIKKSSTNLIPLGTIITATRVGLGKICVLEQDTAINQDLKAIIPKTEELDNTFLYWWLKSIAHVIVAAGTGATVQGVKLTFVKALEIPLPPIPEQKRIVALLDTVFADLEQTRAKTEQNLKNARELFDSYLQQVFSQKGNGWVDKEIGEVADLSRGQNPPKSEFIYEPREGYVRFYQIRDGKSDKFAVYVPENSKLHYVNETDILMVAYRHVGNAFRGVKGAFNVALCKIANKDKEVLHDDFLYHLIPSSFIKGELLKVSERSLIPSMSVKHLAQLKIPIPPPHEQDEIVRKINIMDKECNRLEFIYKQKVEALDELKKSILQKAFSGELTTTAK